MDMELVKKKRSDWLFNHEKIRDAIIEILAENKLATIREVAKRVGMNKKHVHTHMKYLRFEPIKHPLRFLTNDIIQSLAKKALSGSYKHMELWFKLMEGYSEKNEIKNTGELTLKTDIDFESLSSEMLNKILLAKNNQPKQ